MQITKDITPEEIADKVLMHFDNVAMTDFDSAANAAGFTYELINKLDLARKVAFAKIALSESLQYIEPTGNGNTWFLLNGLGRQVKNAGGHFAYLKRLEEKAIADKERQERKDQSDKLDLHLKQWQVKTKYLPYIVSIFALTVSIFSYFKPEKKQLDLQQVQQDLQQLKDHVKSQDSLFRVDTLAKKHK
jgi:hypothetical protein